MHTRAWLGLGLGLALLAASCGNPEIQLPEPLEVVYLPLAGAVDVEPDVAVEVFFSGDVDPGSVSSNSVRLERGVFTPGEGDEPGTCAAWQSVERQPAIADGRPRVVRVGPDAERLEADACYRLTCTTDVKGVALGPLPDLGLPGQPGVGAQAVFRTRP